MDGGVAEALRARFGGDALLDDDLGRLSAIHDGLRRERVPRTAVHGDLWVGNVLLDGVRVAGVVDWEMGAARGEPVRDLVRFPLMYALYLDRHARRRGGRVAGHRGLRASSWGAGVEYALDGRGWFPELFRRFVCEGLVRLGGSPDRWRDAAIAGLAEGAAFSDDEDFAGSLLELFRRATSRTHR
jgi:hypothetical protein